MPISNFSSPNAAPTPMSPQQPVTIISNDDDGAVDAASFLIDYNDRFAGADAALFRDGVVRELMEALISQRKPNALLVGPAGTGKTRVVEDLARRIAAKDPTVPTQLAGSRVMELPLTNLVAGAGIVGDIEKRLKSLVAFAEDPANRIILFIDEIHQLASLRDPTYGKIAQVLKPALARGDMRVIGATTTQESRRLDRDPAFSRRFTKTLVDELTPEQTEEVLRRAWPSMEAHYDHAVLVDDERFAEVVRIADTLGSAGSHRPDNAITLLDRACADAVVTKSDAVARATANPATAQSAAVLAATPANLTTETLRAVALRQACGHSLPDRLDLGALDDGLSRIKGQDRVVAKVRRLLRLRDTGAFDDGRPTSMLFAGPSGVGKSEVARIVSRVLFDEEPITLNMCEYADHMNLTRITGSSAGYVGSDSNAELPFDTLEANPYRLVLLDEFEKADRSVQRLFMSALEDGYFKIASGRVVDFRHAVVIATTNAGSSAGASRAIGFTETTADPDRDLGKTLSQWFDPELVNRFGLVTRFDAIGRDVYADILADEWSREAPRVAAATGADIAETLEGDDLDRIVEATYRPEFGARPAKRAVRDEIERILLEE